MLKKSVTYTDFDGSEVTETLTFNITKVELADNLHMREELEELQKMFEGDERTLETREIQAILDLVKKFMQLSYGEIDESGPRKRFVKTPATWENFQQTAAYDQFLMDLFTDTTQAFSFLLDVMPQDLRDGIEKDMLTQHGFDLKEVTNPTTEVPTAPPVLAQPQPQPNTNTPISDEDLLKMDPDQMSREQMLRAMKIRNQQ